MKLQFWSIGKSHDSYVKEGVEDFTKRISHYYPVEWKILPPAVQTRNSTPAEVMRIEAKTILQNLNKEEFLVLLDERGRQLTSPQLAALIEDKVLNGTRQLIFLIGGAFGVDAQVRERANLIWSFSLLVFPHQLMRLLLAEQVYRACTIIRNEKYHHQ